MKLLGLLAVDRPSQLVEKMFETAVLLGQRDDLGTQRLDNPSHYGNSGATWEMVRLMASISSWRPAFSMSRIVA